METEEVAGHVYDWFLNNADTHIPDETIIEIAELKPQLTKEQLGTCVECYKLSPIYKIKWHESNTRYWYGCKSCLTLYVFREFDLHDILRRSSTQWQSILPEGLFKKPTIEFNNCHACKEPMFVDGMWGERYTHSNKRMTTARIALIPAERTFDARAHEFVTVNMHQECTMHCSGCRQVWAKNSYRGQGYDVWWYFLDDKTYCIKCYDEFEHNNSIWECSSCGDETVSDGHWSDRSSDNVCERCWRTPIECTSCGEEVLERYLMQGNHECSSQRYIKNYSYKPRPKFFGNAPYHMGFELEVECKDRDDEDYDEDSEDSPDLFVPSKYAFETIGNRGYLKYDGSLSCGFEIVTHPHSLLEYQTNFPWELLEGLARKRMVSWNSDNCGLHIHVGRVAFDPSSKESKDNHQIRFLKLIYDNQRQVTRLAGRTSSYARFNDKGKLIPKIKFGQQEGRYAAVNVENEATLEVRVFKGSLKKERVLAQLEFVHSAVEYTRNLRVVPKDNPFSWARYVGYVANNYTTYPHLFELINKLFATETAVTGD